jgi:hypothetical protein
MVFLLQLEGTQMLQTIDGKTVGGVPHREDFDALLSRLGSRSADSIRDYLDEVIGDLPPDEKTGLRTFNSSELGRKLTPWQHPLSRLYHLAWEFLGVSAKEEEVQDRAALWFGLFVWERIMDCDELWMFWDPNLSSTDPNREPLGKVYFEQPA